MKRIIVTGGAGFLGSNLCSRLLKEGNEVLCVDNFYTGRKSNIQKLMDNKSFEVIRHDITLPIYIEGDEIYNLACPASPPHYQFNPVQTTKTSVIGSINMLGIAKRLKIPILQASTSEVYGDPEVHPQPESYRGCVSTTGIRSCYSEDTEVLTDKGWRLFKDLDRTEKIAVLNNDDSFGYETPSEFLCEKYDGKMIEFSNLNIDLMVTPNHKMLVKKRCRKKYELIEAREDFDWRRSYLLKSSLSYKGKYEEWFYFNKKNFNMRNAKKEFVEKINMNDWLQFLGYYLSEGNCDISKRIRVVNSKEYETYSYRVQISQSKEKNFKTWSKINSLLERLPFKFSYSGHQFTICNKQLFQYVNKFGKSHQKFIPQDILNLSTGQLKILLSSLCEGDVSFTKTRQNKERICYYSTSKDLLGNIQEILLKIGWIGNITVNRSNEDDDNKFSVYCINIIDPKTREKQGNRYSNRLEKYYSGNVYCVTVPSHKIFVRRNGKVVICGNCYDEGKRCAETLFFDYNRQYKTDIKVIRIFNTYGPNLCPGDGRVVSNFIVQALKNENITIYGNGNQTRSFCYVDDLIDGMIKMMNSKDFTGPVNLGNPTENTILELAEKIINLTNSNSEIVFNPLPQDDPVKRKPVIDLAKEKLNWEPKVSLEEGLKSTINYFREKLNLF